MKDAYRDVRLPTLAARLERFTVADNRNGCVLWCGSKTERGYGRISFNRSRRMVHQLVWEEANGPMPTGHVIRHKCDVPSCVNANHLEIGLQRDNVADMDARGRRKVGGGRDERGRFAGASGVANRSKTGVGESKSDVPEVFG